MMQWPRFADSPLYLGCPVWACADWRGSLYTREASRDDYLPQYASVFNAVEGNSIFYALPAPAVVARWARELPAGFHLCVKFPSALTHRAELVGVERECTAFLELLRPLQHALGPLLLQLGPAFGPARLPVLANFLGRMSREFPVAVELRHPEFFVAGAAETELLRILRGEGVDRVIFDTRSLHAAPSSDESTAEAQARKPQLPIREDLSGPRPMLRLVLRNEAAAAQPYLAEWAPRIARWLAAGHSPQVFVHTPDDRHAPSLARELHRLIRAQMPALPALNPFPGESEAPPSAQLALF